MFETRIRNYSRIPASATVTIPVTSDLLRVRILILQAKKTCTKAEVIPCPEVETHTYACNICYPQSYQELESINEVNACPSRISK